VQLNYKSFGEGPAFIILHGLMGQLDNWQTIGKQIAKEYSVYLVDIRNHGKSPHVDTHSYTEIAEDIKEFMGQQGIPSATIPHHNDVFEAFLSVPINEVTSRKEVEEILKLKIADPGIVLFLMKNLSRKGKDYAWKMNLEVLNRDYNNIITPTIPTWPVEVETLFVRGGDSHYILDEDWEMIIESFPEATLETVANAGHWVQAQQPKKLLEILLG